jgi:hypothetical protein
MRIVGSTVDLASAHVLEIQRSVTEQARVVTSPAPAPTGDTFEPAPEGDNRKLDHLLDKLGRLLERQRTGDSAELDHRISRLVDRIRKLFNAQYGTPHSQPPSSTPTRLTADYRRTESIQEAEATSVRASGTVVTDDGRQIDFSQALDLARAYARTTTTIASVHQSATVAPSQSTSAPVPPGAAPNPVASVPAAGALQIDGAALGYDRNGDGKIEASELLGTAGNGFAQLAELDSDGNGFVDSGDAAMGRLALVDGGTTTSVTDRGIGALYTGSVAAPFGGTGPGALAAAGLYLNENGTTGFIRQVNLTA